MHHHTSLHDYFGFECVCHDVPVTRFRRLGRLLSRIVYGPCPYTGAHLLAAGWADPPPPPPQVHWCG